MSAVEQALIKYSTSGIAAPASIGDNTLVAVPTGKRLKLISGVVSASGGANNVSLKIGTPLVVPLINLAAGGFYILDYNPAGWGFGASGDDLIANLSAALAVGISFTYFLWDA